jgi:prophage regulatory protein
MKSKQSPRRLIRRDELQRRVPYSMVHIWRLEHRGEFPKRIPIGENRVAWDEAEVEAWLEDRIRASGKILGPRAKRMPTTKKEIS